MTQRRPMIAGNWKMYKTITEAVAFTRALHAKVAELPAADLPEIVLCPPAISLVAVKEEINELNAPFRIMAQTMESRDEGAYTGEISPLMLVDAQMDGVVIGHSERRQYYNETDETVNAKVQAALKHGLTPIVCVGESLEQREAGQTDDVIRRQVKVALDSVDTGAYAGLVIAYEPVWAIGTGKVCEAPEAARVCGLIRKTLGETAPADATRILYGGSVKPDNIRELIKQDDIDGALVGGASLDPESFTQLIAGSMLLPVQPGR